MYTMLHRSVYNQIASDV